MTDITELAQRMKTAAEKLDADQWQTRKGFSGIEVIVKGSLEKGHGCVSFQPVAADMADTKTARAIALFSPANVLALVEVLEKAQQRIAELDIKNCELDSLTQRWAVERAENADRIAELESRTVTVKLPEPPGPMSVGARTVYFGIVADVVSAFQYGLTAAGIKVEVE